ncbi:MAG: hypothetical protein ACRDN0_01610 [Trebonia sp.]
MPVIVGVHGIAQQFKGGYQLETAWYDAIRDGLVAAGQQPRADALASADVRVAFFGNLFRPRGAMAAQDPPYLPTDVEPGPEREILTQLYQAALAQDPSLRPPEGAMGKGTVAVQVMLERLLRSKTFAKVGRRAFIGNLKQVTKFLTDPTVKELVLQRVHEQADQQTRVLIGHSLGSIVAYEYLCRYQPPSVELLVTLGSPLGIPNLVFEKLTPAPVDGQGAWPGLTARWVNVADANDVVAMRKKLAGLFAGLPRGGAVDDRSVDNGEEPHAVDRYLNARQTGSALGDILG